MGHWRLILKSDKLSALHSRAKIFDFEKVTGYHI